MRADAGPQQGGLALGQLDAPGRPCILSPGAARLTRYVSVRIPVLLNSLRGQVLGHSKTVLVLLGGWAFLGDRVSSRQAFGMALAVAGMVAYGVASSQCGPLTGMVPPGFSPVCLPARSAWARAPRVGSE